jgi:outer membrane protein assembly factor BamD
MRKPALILTLPLAALLAVPTPGRALDLPGWVPFIGKKEQAPAALAPTSGQEAEAREALRQAEQAENAGDQKGAAAGYRLVVRDYSLTTSAAKAQLQLGRLLERQGDFEKAYDAYAAYTAKYPRGGDLDAVIQAQFNIAKAHLEGKKKKRVLGLSLTSAGETAQKMFEGIVKSAPFHRLAPQAQFNVGQALEQQGKPAEAMIAYNEVIIRYPNDPVADDAQYQIGYVRYRETVQGSEDQADRMKAREAFEDFVNRYPTSEKAAQARENIGKIGATDIKKTHDIAKYYDKVKNYKAAVVYYNEVIRIAPATPESEASRKRIDELKSLVGVDALRAGPEKAQSGDMALARRRAQARVDVASRPDYNGPPIAYPYPTTTGAGRPAMRTSPLGPVVEPALPMGDPLQGTPGAPGAVDPLLPAVPPGAAGTPATPPPNLPPPPDAAPAPNSTDTKPAQ